MKKFLLAVSFVLLLLVTTIDYSKMVDAGTETPFGGMHTITLDSSTCDCGGNSHFILDYRTNNMLKLYKAPQSIFYQNNNADGLYQLGTYSQPESYDCQMYIYYECVTIIYNDGDYGSQPGTGTTLN